MRREENNGSLIHSHDENCNADRKWPSLNFWLVPGTQSHGLPSPPPYQLREGGSINEVFVTTVRVISLHANGDNHINFQKWD